MVYKWLWVFEFFWVFFTDSLIVRVWRLNKIHKIHSSSICIYCRSSISCCYC